MKCIVYGGVSGQDDVAAISAALAAADNVLLEGTFSHPTGAFVKIANRSNISLRGKAVLNNIRLSFNNVDGLTVEDLTLTGTPGGSNIAINNCHNVKFNRVTIDNPTGGGFAAFSIYVPANTTSKRHTYNECRVLGGNRTGFLISGTTGLSHIENFVFNRCEALRCGLLERVNEWVTGYNLSEVVIADSLRVVDCKASYCWESGFHQESRGVAQDVVFERCTADYNGQKPGAEYGHGLFVTARLVTGCIARGNAGCGIRLRPSIYGSVTSGNVAEGNTAAGMFIACRNLPTTIQNNIVIGGAKGIHIYGPDTGETSGAIVIGNCIRQATTPISVYHAPNSIIEHNITEVLL